MSTPKLDPLEPNLLSTREFPEPLRRQPAAPDNAPKKPTGDGSVGRERLREAIIGTIPPPEKKKPEPKADEKQEQDKTPAPAIDAKGIAEAAASAATKAVLTARSQDEERERARQQQEKTRQEEAQKAAPKLEVPERFAKDLPIYRALAEANPAKYGDITTRLSRVDQKEAEYSRDWQAKNPGKPYDPNDDEHTPFFESQTIEISQKEWSEAEKKAETSRIKSDIKSEFKAEQDQKLQEEQRKAASGQLVEKVRSTLANDIIGIAKRLIPDLELKGDKVDDQIKSIDEASPALTFAIETPLRQHMEAVQAALAISSGLAQFNQQDPSHQVFLTAVRELDQLYNSQPESSPLRKAQNGSTYVSPGAWINLSPEDKARHFTLTQDEVVQYLGTKFEMDVEARFKRLSGSGATNPSQSNSGDGSGAGSAQARQPEEPKRFTSVSTSAGASGGQGPVVGNRPTGKTPGSSAMQRFVQNLGVR